MRPVGQGVEHTISEGCEQRHLIDERADRQSAAG